MACGVKNSKRRSALAVASVLGMTARQLWLLRHGDAEPQDARADFDRRLTPRGEQQARAAGQAIAGMGVQFAAILTSPRVRALDTARLAADAWGGVPEIYDALSGGLDARGALDALARVDGDGQLLLVGHEPDFSNIVAELTGARIDLKKGGLAVVRVAAGGGELVALLRPRELTRIAAAAPAAAE
jgi:phosphohistidine phosphatase